mmetsp:Transcript_72361/g.157861  ORF Transcript_72361/g.157861 Transcript_72361/m.157861 type:complete len:183 (+) Transcript_72361:150-698(+)
MAVSSLGDGQLYVYMEAEISNVNIGRMIFKLYQNICPKTVENFRCLCTGERGAGIITKMPLHYKGAKFHRIIPGFMAQGGDFELGDGRGGESIYGGKFSDEAGGLALRHGKRGLLSMANSGKDTNGSQFFICTKATPHLDGKHVVFGEVIEGYDTVVKKMESIGSGSGSTSAEVIIEDCGEL